MLEVTRTYLPSRQRFQEYLDAIWDSHMLTNNGPFVQQLEMRLQTYAGSPSVLACTNGTIAIQLALKAMGISREVITTPFSYVATTNAALWEGCKPVFVDVRQEDLTIDPAKIEAAITPDTQAILATHVYGYPCDVMAIDEIARRHGLKVIYDAANAFGTFYQGRSIFSFGDISTCSFHATKLFHSGEGGALFINDDAYTAQLSLYRSFGHIHDDYYTEGINGKMSELHAALGLCVLEDVDQLIDQRRLVSGWYDELLDRRFRFMRNDDTDTKYNYAYYPILLGDEEELRQMMKAFRAREINPRRYFYPSLNTLPFLEKMNACPVSEDAASRILCLPLSHYTTRQDVERICDIANNLN